MGTIPYALPVFLASFRESNLGLNAQHEASLQSAGGAYREVLRNMGTILYALPDPARSLQPFQGD